MLYINNITQLFVLQYLLFNIIVTFLLLNKMDIGDRISIIVGYCVYQKSIRMGGLDMKRFAAILLIIAVVVLSIAGCVDSNKTVSSSASASSKLSLSSQSSSGGSSSQNVQSNISSTSSVAQADKLQSKMKKLTSFYAPVQASCVYTVDITNMDKDTVDMLRSVQGYLSEYYNACVYLVETESDTFWKKYAESEIGAYFQEITPEKLIEKYKSKLNGVVVYTPDTFEYSVAYNVASSSQYVLATETVAEKFGLHKLRFVKDIRNVYADKFAAYTELFSEAEYEYVYLAKTYDFADYAYAVDALFFDIDDTSERDIAFLTDLLSIEQRDNVLAVFADYDSDKLLNKLSLIGCGMLNVDGFKNATFFSSVTIAKKFTAKQPSVNSAGAAQTVYVSFVIRSESLGNVINSDYSIFLTDNDLPVSYEISSSIYELAPLVSLWYNSNSVSNKRVVAGGWCRIDEKLIPYEMYKAWHKANNQLITKLGIGICVTDSLREDAIFGENFGYFSSATGIIVCDSSGDGYVWMSKQTPVIETVNIMSLNSLNSWMSEAEATATARYYALQLDRGVLYDNVANLKLPDVDAMVKQFALSDESCIATANIENILKYGSLDFED